jgi:hypothetical protein
MNPPASDKIDKISNAGDYVNSKINIGVIPVIFCNKDCRASYDHAKTTGVLIIDKSGIIKLSDLVTNGKTDEACTFFNSLLFDAKRNGQSGFTSF